MRAQASEQIVGAGVACSINRFAPTSDATGRKVGTYDDILSGGTEQIWIQPVAGTSDVAEAGLDQETTHLAYQAWSGTPLEAKDRLSVVGDPYVYDVIRANVFETHRRAELKQVRRM